MGPPLEQAVQRRRRHARLIGEALGGAARGRGERDAQALPREDGDDPAHDRRLADAGAARDDGDLARERERDGLGLLARERDARLLLVPGERLGHVDRDRGGAPLEQLAQPDGHGALGAGEVGVVHGGARVEGAGVDLVVEDHVAGAREPIDGLTRELLGDLEQRRRLAHEPLARHEDVAVRRRVLDDVTDAGLDAHVRLLLDAERRRELVGREEADAPHVEREAVRILTHARDGRPAVALVDARRESRRDAVALQEHHDLAAPPAACSRPRGSTSRAPGRCPTPR